MVSVYAVYNVLTPGFAAKTRENANRVDLNRNFPDQYRASEGELQRETQNIIQWLEKSRGKFAISANFHGGDLVVNYPFDGFRNDQRSGDNKSPDNDVFISISRAYASPNPTMTRFDRGITNGAKWYPLYGGMQDVSSSPSAS